jgi:hypothetical protein
MMPGLAVKLVMDGAGPVPPPPLLLEPQATTHMHAAETVAIVTSRIRSFISVLPIFLLQSFAKVTGLPDN